MAIQKRTTTMKKKKKKIDLKSVGDIFRKRLKIHCRTVLMCVLIITSQKDRKSFGNFTVRRI